MIVIVAPYSPYSKTPHPNLGASRKLETIIRVISTLNYPIVLINSAHNDRCERALQVFKCEILGVTITEIIPPLSKKAVFGKLKNLFYVNEVIEIIAAIGTPKFFWFYNGYSFEMIFAKKAHTRFKKPIILEFEDWHFSRSRGFSLKPYLDYFCWLRAAKVITASYVVNSMLYRKMIRYSKNVQFLPGVVPKELIETYSARPPFSKPDGIVRVGYFGGLSIEKGADIILEILELLPENYQLCVTGTGPLENLFIAAAIKYPDKFSYMGILKDSEFYKLMSSCDILLNPHSPIQFMNDGVFPFKVLEAVASGRVLISTELNGNGFNNLLLGVRFVKPKAVDFLSAILSSAIFYETNSIVINNAATETAKRFGEEALLESIKNLINFSVKD